MAFALVEPPKGLPTIDEMINSFRDLFTTKIKEISKNYIMERNTGIWRFKSDTEAMCQWNWLPAYEEVTKIEYKYAKADGNLVENLYYYDCYQSINFHETVETKGTVLKPLTSKEVSTAVRKFDLNKNEIFRKYELSSFEGNQLFKVVIHRNGNQKVARFSFSNQTFLKIHYEYGDDVTKVTYSTYPYLFIYKRLTSKWVARGGRVASATVVSHKTPEGKTIFRNTDGFLLSFNGFQQFLSDNIYSGPLNEIKNVMKSHIANYPATNFTSDERLNSRVLDELELARIQLLTPNELNINEVKRLILDLATSIKEGRLQTSGPRDQK